ncbi:MAG: DUF262 domain-containing protein [Leptolyngbya sp. SIOISBB]|nr:DUF262 domain-containing protein [Leptolyngbya sp. SIOISBB]
MSLEQEVEENRKSIRTDGYPMSIGELTAMYKDGELRLRPDFQRFFRWSPEQKSKLLESFLLGIPIPSIFVHQRLDGVWDVVDGLQRLSTIFEIMGILKNEDGDFLPPLVFKSTKYLPSLEGKTWGINEVDETGIGGTLQRIFKRSKLDIKIVLRESDSDTKLELFQRLNTGGSSLTTQELRNCQIIMVEPEALEHIKEMAAEPSFIECCALSDRNLEEQYDLELVTRFITLRRWNPEEPMGDLGPFLDENIVEIAASEDFPWPLEKDIFKSTFKLLAETAGSDSFRRYDAQTERFKGGFSVSAFEVIALGLGYLIESKDLSDIDVVEKIKQLWMDSSVIRDVRGRRSADRLRNTLPFGRQFMGQ